MLTSLTTTFALLIAGTTDAHAADDRPYAAPGPKAVTVSTLAGSSGSSSASTKIVAPTSGGPYPLIVASHGWSASGDNQVGWARLFASHGFVVAVPSFPSPLSPDTNVNADIIVGLVNNLRSGAAATSNNVLTTAKVGLEGHSAGGLATSVAAAKLAPSNVLGGVVLFDPVDKDDAGKAAYAKLCVPVLGVFAMPSSCNTQASWRTFAATTTADLVAFDVVGSTHCDGENANRPLCGLACGGGADPERQKVYGNYATAFFLAHLANDAAASAVLAKTKVASDTGVASPLHGSSTCAPSSSSSGGSTTPDGGGASSSSSSGSTSSSASSSSGGAQQDPSAAGSSSPSTDGSSSDGCGAAPSGGKTSDARFGVLALMSTIVVIVTLGRRRHRHRHRGPS